MSNQANRDEDDALADADYESWNGPWWWRLCERYPAAIAIALALLGMTPYFWRT